MSDPTQIQGLPPGAQAVPINQAAPVIKGLPPGAQAVPVNAPVDWRKNLPGLPKPAAPQYGPEGFEPVPGKSLPGSSEGANLMEANADWVESGPLQVAKGIGEASHAGGNAPGQATLRKQSMHHILGGLGNTALPVAPFAASAAPIPFAVSAATGYGGGKLAAAGTKLSGGDEDAQNLAEDIGQIAGGALGAKGVSKLTAKPPLASVTKPSQESAFNVLHPENATADTSVLPVVRNAAAQQGVTGVPKGRNAAGVRQDAVTMPQRVMQGAIDSHEARVQAVKTPFEGYVQDNTGAAQAALSKITPEMQIAAKTNPQVAKQIADIQAVAQRAQGANTVGLTDQLRHSWNDELSAELNKSAASQDVSPAATQAKRAAASALRQGFYDNLTKLSGQDVRGLAQTEGQLIEAKAGVTKTGEAALKSRRNDLGPSPRIQAVANAAKKVNLAKPASSLSFLPDAIRAIIDPTSQTPAGQYAARVQRAFGDLGPASPPPPLYQRPAPKGLLPSGPIITPLPADTSGSVPFTPPPVASTFKAQRMNVSQPPSAAGTFEHVPAVNQADAGTLPGAQGRIVPKQLPSGAEGNRGLLPGPGETGGAIQLPNRSQSTLENGRQFDSTASNEGAIPALVRDFLRSIGAHDDAVLPSEVQNVTRNNASGGNAASLEALSRSASEKANGMTRVRIDTRSGRETPIINNSDAVDLKAGPYERIVQRGPQGETTVDEGANARPAPLEPRVNGTIEGKRMHVPKSQLARAVRDGFTPDRGQE